MGTPPTHEDLDPSDRYALSSAETSRLSYLEHGFWQHASQTEIHYASFDLKHFFPRIRTAAILQGFHAAFSDLADRPLLALVGNMLRFTLDKFGTTPHTLSNVEPRFGSRQITGIPTGLFVSGFLANVAMLPVDNDVDARIRRSRSIAHFRFVDDHTVLSYSFDGLRAWLESYQAMLHKHDVGTDLNPDKYEPEGLRTFMGSRSKKHLDDAVQSTRIDGANPTPLLTKTLQQVSAIAVTNPNVLDDDDLTERLELLEWLLLADIPDRELRSDTRAAFAAGRIADLAPLLVQETEHLVDVARSVAALEAKAQALSGERPVAAHHKELHAQLLEKRKDLAALSLDQAGRRDRHLRRCFHLLIRAFREYPSKARLFFRLYQYCRLTGYSGLSDITNLIRELRKQERQHWADYYAGLSLQLLARGLPLACRALTASNGLRSDRTAALTHLRDVTSIDPIDLRLAPGRETWYYVLARQAFGVALLAASRLTLDDDPALSARLERLASFYVQHMLGVTGLPWETETGYPPGVWAHMIEAQLRVDQPSAMWRAFEHCFFYQLKSDRLAARRYPEVLSERAWSYLLRFPKTLRVTDAGWICEVIRDNPDRLLQARASRRRALTNAAHAHDELASGRWITLHQWTEFVLDKCDEFDPRRGEWTALELVRQIVEPIAATPNGFAKSLDYLHPSNVLLSTDWTNDHLVTDRSPTVRWEQWRTLVKGLAAKHGPPRIRTAVADYRYGSVGGDSSDQWQRRLISVGRVLLGILRCNFGQPRLWNMRGNERVHSLSTAALFASLSISTPTLALLDGCLTARAAETRRILGRPHFFGLSDESRINDTAFDPPLLLGPAALLENIEEAQRVLVENQLAIAGNQPRQLLPFRLKDFGTGAAEPDQADEET